MTLWCLALVSLVSVPTLVSATNDVENSLPAEKTADTTMVIKGRTLHPKTGTVDLGDHLASLNVPPELHIFLKDEARFIVEDVCHNPKDPTVIGLVMPTGEGEGQGEWMTVISYDPENGHVSDSDAKGMDFEALLKEMQQSALDSNEERKKSGFDAIELRAWAEPPHYDPLTHKLYWAKRLKFSSEKDETLNYCVRILTRRGVLEMNTIDDPSRLAEVAAAAQKLLAQTAITEKEGYEKFDSSVDKVALGGIAALITGGVLAKTGFFAIIGKFLLAFIKPILIGCAVAGSWVWKIVTGNKSDSESQRSRQVRTMKQKTPDDSQNGTVVSRGDTLRPKE